MGECRLCPRNCGVDRTHEVGFCGAGTDLEAASVCLHRGEEPPIAGPKGILNVFFSYCNLQCVYCQNRQISSPDSVGVSGLTGYTGIAGLTDRICELLPHSDGRLGLVTAAHYADRIPALLEAVRSRVPNLIVVYNSSGYERVEALRRLEGLVDIYLPDFKYADANLAKAYSHAPDYPEVAGAALMEMYRQVGSGLLQQDSVAYRGLLVRHLVLPGGVANAKACLDWMVDHLPLNVHISLMSQYFPPVEGLPAPLDRTLRADEYAEVVDYFYALGFTHGFLQEPGADNCYRPDFTRKDHPFE